MKRFASLLLACLATASACSNRQAGASPDAPAAAAATRPLRIAMIGKSSTNPSFLSARLGAERQARELSTKLGRAIEIEWMTPPQEDADVQAQRIRQAVSDHMDAILLSCSDEKKVTPAIDEAARQGVPVMTFDSDAPTSRRFAYCGVDDVKAGEAVMGELARVLSGKAKVAVLAGNRNAPNLHLRVEGVLREAARHPELRIVGTFYHAETPDEASAEVLRAQAAHPDIAGWAMVGGWPLYTQTLLRELEAGDRSKAAKVPAKVPPKIPKIVSMNALPPQLVYVERGIVPVLLAQPTYLWGQVGVDTIVAKLVLKKAVPERIPMDLIRVSAENLGSWARKLREWGFSDVQEEYLQRQ